MELWVGAVAALLLLLIVLRVASRLRRRRRRFIARWAARNGYTMRRDTRARLFVQGPPFDRGEGARQRALLVGVCADRPALITYFSWHDGDARHDAGSCLALVLELPGSVPPLQIDSRRDAGISSSTEDFGQAYRVTCDLPGLVRTVVHPRMIRFLLSGPHLEHVNVRLDGTALIVWFDRRLTRARQLSTLHDFATEIYRLIPESVYADQKRPKNENPVDDRPPTIGRHEIDIHGRPGEVWQTGRAQGAEVFVSLPVETAWPRLSIVAYELLADQYNATSFDKPHPSAHPLIDVMFAVRSTDEDFRRKVLADLADWLPIDGRTRRCGMLLDLEFDSSDPHHDRCVGRITAYAPGEVTNTALVDLCTDVVHELSQRLSADTYRHRRGWLPADLTIKQLDQQA